MTPVWLGRLQRRIAGWLGMASSPRVPYGINWDLTYACPLKCGHCYSESGRRASRQLPLADLMRIADVFLGLRPVPQIVFSGGEPIVVKGFLELAAKLKAGGAAVILYTSGWKLKEETARSMAGLFDRIGVSIDGADAAVNDFIRERQGSFDEAFKALQLLDRMAAERRAQGLSAVNFGIECTMLRSNLHKLEPFCTDIAPRLPHLAFLRLGALIPTGSGSRESYVERELLTDEQMRELPALARRLRKLAPRSLRVEVYDNLGFRMSPAQLARGLALDTLLKVEADGRVRAMDIYEGTVGHILDEPFDLLWQRTLARHRDPFVVDQLTHVQSMRDWARACRAIDLHFAAPEDRERIMARPDALPVPPGLRPN